MALKLKIILGSTRPGRVGPTIGRWLTDAASEHGLFEVELVDLAELGLPLLDEPHHPRLRQYVHQHTKDWSATVDDSDAFVIVTPEYNSGYPAALKNAIDYLHEEWCDKPVGFVSYGGVSAGTRAVQQLKTVVATLKMVAVCEAVNIPFHPQFIDRHGRVQANDIMEQAAAAMLDELARVECVLRSLRAPAAQAEAA